MNKLSRCLTSTCLLFTGYASTGAVLADASSMPAFVKEAVEKTKECKRAARVSHKAGQKNARASECALACKQAYSLYRRQQDQKSQLAQMERCTQLYNAYKSPDKVPVTEDEFPEITRMPSTVEEMVSRMVAMKPEGRVHPNKPCVSGVETIRNRQFDIKQATPYWESCVNSYKARMENNMRAKKVYGR